MTKKSPDPSVKQIKDIKHLLMQPALTSHFHCYFPVPESVRKFVNYSFNSTGDKRPGSSEFTNLMMLSCSDASLPGSSLATHELNNDVTGVSQKHAYRRLYDEQSEFTFYVDETYTQIRFFESWMRYIAGESENIQEAGNLYRSYRIRYPEQYKTSIYITKFERNIGTPNIKGKNRNETKNNKTAKKMVYTFFNAFPISIASMPVSYESSQLLKVTVSFSYDRYVAGNSSIVSSSPEPGQTTASSVPKNPFGVSSYLNPTQEDLNSITYDFSSGLPVNVFNYSSGSFTNTNFADINDPTRVFENAEINQSLTQSLTGNYRLF